jgi:nucleotide-binding universal stress UspA family protein
MFNHALCATDGSEEADRALEYAGRIAAESGGELHVVHVIERLVAGNLAGQDADFFEQDHALKLRRQCVALNDRGVTVTLHTPYAKVGTVARCVVDVAEDNDVDLIVVGTTGRSGLPGGVLGSVARGLLRIASCPVLAIPDRCRSMDAPFADVKGDA